MGLRGGQTLFAIEKDVSEKEKKMLVPEERPASFETAEGKERGHESG